MLDVDSDRIEEVISRDVVLPDTEEWISRIFLRQIVYFLTFGKSIAFFRVIFYNGGCM